MASILEKDFNEPVSNTSAGEKKTARQTLQHEFEMSYQRETEQHLNEKLAMIVTQICVQDPYIGCVAQSEVHFCKMKEPESNEHDYSEIVLGESPGADQLMALGQFKKEGEDENEDQLQQGVAILEELCLDHPTRILAYVKLWQFHRS